MIRFGTDGVRGEAGRPPMTAEVAVRVGRAAVKLARLSGGDRVLIARDTRPSGPMLTAGVASGVAAQGGEAVLADVLPTSGVMANLAAGTADVGVMVTASHNPAPDNGFKVIGVGGHKLSDEQSARFEAWLAEEPEPCVPGLFRPDGLGARQVYHRALADAAPAGSALDGLRIAVDLAHGAAIGAARWLRERYPGVDWRFTGTGDGVVNSGVGSEHPAHLAALVRDEGCDAGIAVDGDADRCVLIDDRGEVVCGDALIWWLARGAGVRSLAVSVMSTTALEAALPDVRIERTPVGDRHLMHAMRQHGIPLGGEESGHVIFADGLPGGDGVLTGLRALALVGRGRPLSAQLAPFRPHPRRTARVPAARKPPIGELPALQAAIAAAETDLGASGRVLVRYSGTEPALRVLVEGVDAAAVARAVDAIVAAAREGLA
jgi:phosphoglucosamine mutase